MRSLCFFALFLVAGCGGGSTKPTALRHSDRMTIWTEELPADKVEARLTFAGQNKLNLNVSVVEGKVDHAYLQTLCAAAEKNDVALRFWPGISHAEGYWASQANADHFVVFVDQLLDMARDVCPRLDGVVIDMEMPIYRVETLTTMRAQGKTDVDIAKWFLANVDETAFEHARTVYNDAGVRVRARGYSYSVTTLPMNADDYADLDETIAKALWTPIEGIEWDSVSFQVYRSLYDQNFPPKSGQPYTSGLITSYTQTAVEKWGAKAAIDLGVTGGGIGVTQNLKSAAELQSDIAAALAAGVTVGHINLFSLEGLDGKSDAAAWVIVPAPRAAAPTADDLEPRTQFKTLDLLGQ